MSTVGVSVLVFDDNRLSWMVLENKFRAAGRRVSLTGAAGQGLELAFSLSPDPIAPVPGLEEMSGVELIGQHKNPGQDKQHPVRCVDRRRSPDSKRAARPLVECDVPAVFRRGEADRARPPRNVEGK